ncbi:MAG: flippase-like domain-containing protein [Deltaproteobacteria bacterium]|nr:flippase-like domain-containing protein [Deltaproteobacteria bacterium]
MKLAINLVLSLGMLALCVYFVWPNGQTVAQLEHAWHALSFGDFAPYLGGYLGLLLVVHLCRALRWNNLLAPIGVKLPTGPLLAISSVGFMAILALPARLGEFVRPGLLRQRGVSGTQALGTVAVERIVDGLIISLLVFGACFSLRGPSAPDWMMPTAWVALGVFTAAMVFLLLALRRPQPTVAFFLRLSLLPRLAPKLATAIEHKLVSMIRGFEVLNDGKNLAVFVVWSVVYWFANGLGVWVLAKGFHMIDPAFHLSVIGALATMGIVAVGIMLPNSPGNFGQFQWFTVLGLSLYIPGAANKDLPIYATAFAFANLHYFLQLLWYMGMGLLGLLTPWVSFHDLAVARARSLP